MGLLELAKKYGKDEYGLLKENPGLCNLSFFSSLRDAKQFISGLSKTKNNITAQKATSTLTRELTLAKLYISLNATSGAYSQNKTLRAIEVTKTTLCLNLKNVKNLRKQSINAIAANPFTNKYISFM